MKYKEYAKKHYQILEPLEEAAQKMSILSLLRMFADEIRGDFGERLESFAQKEIQLLRESEVET